MDEDDQRFSPEEIACINNEKRKLLDSKRYIEILPPLDHIDTPIDISEHEVPMSELEEIAKRNENPVELKLKNVKKVRVWEYEEIPGKCLVCYFSLSFMCEGCTDAHSTGENWETCTATIGKCSHAFHSHCLDKLFKSFNYLCPLCRKEWEPKKTITY